jgi:hypothetical protein
LNMLDPLDCLQPVKALVTTVLSIRSLDRPDASHPCTPRRQT